LNFTSGSPGNSRRSNMYSSGFQIARQHAGFRFHQGKLPTSLPAVVWSCGCTVRGLRSNTVNTDPDPGYVFRSSGAECPMPPKQHLNVSPSTWKIPGRGPPRKIGCALVEYMRNRLLHRGHECPVHCRAIVARTSFRRKVVRRTDKLCEIDHIE